PERRVGEREDGAAMAAAVEIEMMGGYPQAHRRRSVARLDELDAAVADERVARRERGYGNAIRRRRLRHHPAADTGLLGMGLQRVDELDDAVTGCGRGAHD